MEEIKILSAHCSKFKKKFCLEVSNGNGRWEVVNFINISETDAEKIPFDYLENPNGLKTSNALLPCKECGSRCISSCSCPTASERCTADDKYNFQCVYCNNMVLDSPQLSAQTVYVTSHHFDNIGAVLSSMGVEYSPFSSKYDCDLLFINCGTEDYIDCNLLKEYIKNGGCVYTSDLASTYIAAMFPDVMRFFWTGKECKIEADVIDAELKQIAGDRVDILFDLGCWSIIEDWSGLDKYDGKVLLRASNGNRYSGKPIMVSFKYGKGTVFYTSFHNHTQASEKEKMLLQLLLLKQIGTNTNRSVEQVGALMGLNISLMKRKFNEG